VLSQCTGEEEMKVAYLSAGRLFVQDGSNAAREIESAFGQELVRSALQVAQKREWKTRGTGALFMSGGMLWGIDEREQQLRNVRITGMTRAHGTSRLFLALQSPPVGALLVHDLGSGKEKRVLHREHRRSSSGNEECLARSVLCFDLAPDGAIVYSNGTTIFRLDQGGKRSRVLGSSLVESVLVLEG